jgi:hypothetical protein
MKNILRLASVVVFCAVIIGLGNRFGALYADMVPGATARPDVILQRQKATNLGWIVAVIQGFVMLLGIVFSYQYARLMKLKQDGTEQFLVGPELRAMLSSTGFYLALAAAPVVYTLVVLASKGAPVETQMVIAFQNGFFWQAVMPNRPTIN